MGSDNDRYKTLLRRLIISQILILCVLILCGGIAAVMYEQKPAVQQKQIASNAVNVDVFVVQPVTFREQLGGFGTARADRDVPIAAQVTGEIVEIHPSLRVGTAVRGNDVTSRDGQPSERRDADILLRIDPRNYQNLVDQIESRIKEAEAEIQQLKQQERNTSRQLEKAQQDVVTLREEYARVQSAVERNAGSPSELSRALLDLRRYEDTIIQSENQLAVIPLQITAAQQRIETASADLERAKIDLNRTWVTAPFTGLLSEVSVERGQYVRAGEQLVRLTNRDRVEVPVSLPLGDYLQLADAVRDGQRPRVELARNETDPADWTGSVVRTAPMADAASRTVELFVEVDNTVHNTALLPGSFVHARIEGKRYTDTIVIPRAAIRDDAVFVIDENSVAHRRVLQTGRRLQSMIIVESGLAEGDRIVMTNMEIVEDGTVVAVQQKGTLQEEISELRTSVLRLESADPAIR